MSNCSKNYKLCSDGCNISQRLKINVFKFFLTARPRLVFYFISSANSSSVLRDVNSDCYDWRGVGSGSHTSGTGVGNDSIGFILSSC